MIDWTKPVQVLFGSEWLPATVLKVHEDGSVVVEWRASPTPTLNADVFNDDDADDYLRNVAPKPREWWIVTDNEQRQEAFTTELIARSITDRMGDGREIIHVREVLP
jgi:hypothetical protein